MCIVILPSWVIIKVSLCIRWFAHFLVSIINIEIMFIIILYLMLLRMCEQDFFMFSFLLSCIYNLC